MARQRRILPEAATRVWADRTDGTRTRSPHQSTLQPGERYDAAEAAALVAAVAVAGLRPAALAAVAGAALARRAPSALAGTARRWLAAGHPAMTAAYAAWQAEWGGRGGLGDGAQPSREGGRGSHPRR